VAGSVSCDVFAVLAAFAGRFPLRLCAGFAGPIPGPFVQGAGVRSDVHCVYAGYTGCVRAGGPRLARGLRGVSGAGARGQAGGRGMRGAHGADTSAFSGQFGEVMRARGMRGALVENLGIDWGKS